MLKSYFNSAIRILWKNKLYSVITLSGMALAMAGAILLLLWIQNAISMDRFHAKGKSLYKVYQNVSSDGWINTKELFSASVAPELSEGYPDIKFTCRVVGTSNQLVTHQKSIQGNGEFVDPAFLMMFSFPLIAGNAEEALSGSFSMVITEKLAQSLFGRASPMHETILVDGKNYTVTGILKNLPENTQFRFGYLLSWQDITNQETELYVEGIENFSMTKANQKLKGFFSFL